MELAFNLRLSLRNFQLQVNATSHGQVLGIYGRSGSGKTTLIEAICGLQAAVTGSLRFNDQIWLDSEARTYTPVHKRAVGFVPQGSVLFPDRSVLANLRAGRQKTRSNDTQTLERRVIDAFELGSLLSARPTQLSGGEMQRVALGRAICSGAQLLVLDEPTASLGLEFRKKVLPFLARVRQEFHLPMVIVSHEPIDLLYLCDDLLVLSDGQVMAQGPPSEALAGLRELETPSTNLLHGIIREVNTQITKMELDTDPCIQIFVSGSIGAPGQRVALSIGPHQIMLSQSVPIGISAMNIWAGSIKQIIQHSNFAQVELALGSTGTVLRADLTLPALDRVGCQVGGNVYAIVKAVSVVSLLSPHFDSLQPSDGQPTRGGEA